MNEDNEGNEDMSGIMVTSSEEGVMDVCGWRMCLDSNEGVFGWEKREEMSIWPRTRDEEHLLLTRARIGVRAVR